MHGTVLGQTQLGALRLDLVRHRAGQETPRHGHAHACLHIVLRGMYVEHAPTGTVVACPGEVVFKAPEAEHWNHFGASGAESLRFELGAKDFPAAHSEWLGRCTEATSLERALGLGRALQDSTPATHSASQRVSPQTQLLLLLRRDFRQRLVLGELAAKIGMHRSHLTRQFTRDFGCSPQAFVSAKRAAWTAEQLVQGGETLAAIAIAAGFADQSHCTRTFKRIFGMTPRNWTREARW